MPAAPFIFKDAFVSVNSVDLSDWVSSCTVTPNYIVQEVTAMGDDAVKRIAGLQDSTIEVVFHNDFAASATYATISAEWGQGDTTVSVRPTSSVVGSTNPSFNMTGGMLASWDAIAGTVGDVATFTATFQGKITIATS